MSQVSCKCRACQDRANGTADTAADWLARRDLGFDSADRAKFEAWIAADFRHAAAVAELETAWAAINQPRLAGRSSAVLEKIEGLTPYGSPNDVRYPS